MKKIVMFALVMFASLSSVFSQNAERKSPKGNALNQVAALTKQLNLSPEVAEKVKGILTGQMEKFGALRASMKTAEDKKAVRGEMKALNEDTNKQMEALLSADQFTKYKELQDQNRKEAISKDGKNNKAKKKEQE